jgi:hypothetical protein
LGVVFLVFFSLLSLCSRSLPSNVEMEHTRRLYLFDRGDKVAYRGKLQELKCRFGINLVLIKNGILSFN